MRLIFVLMIIAGLFGATYLYGLPYAADKAVNRFLQASQTQTVEFQNLRTSLSQIAIEKITFGPDTFNTIEDVTLNMHWPHQKILNVRIGKMESFHIADTSMGFISLTTEILNKIPALPVQIEYFKINVATPHGDIRFEGDVNLLRPDDQEMQKFFINLRARQYQLSFSARIQGTVKDGLIETMDINVLDGRTNMGPFQLSRLSGWISYQQDETPMTLSGQIDAGIGRFHDLALNKVSLVIAGTHKAPQLLFRSGLSGQPDLSFTTDFNGGTNSVFKSVLKAESLFPLLESLAFEEDIPQSLSDLSDITLTLAYLPERRFQGGPYPFELTLLEDTTSRLTGTALFYPETFELRGSAQTDPELARDIAAYFKLDPEGVSDDFLRLDASLEDWFTSK